MLYFIVVILLVILVPSVRTLLYAAVGYVDYLLERRRTLAVLRATIRRRDGPR